MQDIYVIARTRCFKECMSNLLIITRYCLKNNGRFLVVPYKLIVQSRMALLLLPVHAIYTIKYSLKSSLLSNFKEPNNVLCIQFSKIDAHLLLYHGPSELSHTFKYDALIHTYVFI
jgi:hypothetical protein